MGYRYLTALALFSTTLATGCAGGFETTTGPSGETVIKIPSLVGTWTSSTATQINSSCSNFQWTVTGQTENSITGTFSATCIEGITASGTISGSLVGLTDIPYTVNATASVPGGIPCPITLSGTGKIEGETIRIPYQGNTCLGPAIGEEVLRRPTAPAPPPPPPSAPPVEPQAPPPPPPPVENFNHVGPGGTSADRAYQVIMATSREFPWLIEAKPSEAASTAGAEEMLRRMIWHLQHAGFQAGRQRNPSGAISKDKLTVFADGAWRGYDVFYDLGHPGSPTQVIWWDLNYADPIADGGIAD